VQLQSEAERFVEALESENGAVEEVADESKLAALKEQQRDLVDKVERMQLLALLSSLP
jgi:hypothetical protein